MQGKGQITKSVDAVVAAVDWKGKGQITKSVDAVAVAVDGERKRQIIKSVAAVDGEGKGVDWIIGAVDEVVGAIHGVADAVDGIVGAVDGVVAAVEGERKRQITKSIDAAVDGVGAVDWAAGGGGVELDERMKGYEGEVCRKIPRDFAFIVRSDGKSFSKFTTGLDKVFDLCFTRAMIQTMNDCLVEFAGASCGYCHSDEITLIFPPIPSSNLGGTHMHNGEVQKVVTSVASFISVRFNCHFQRNINGHQSEIKDHYKEPIIRRANAFIACFDGRVLMFGPEKYNEVANHQVWRSMRDCPRNCTSTFARAFFSAKQLHKKGTDEQVEMMAEKKFDYAKVPMFLRHGVTAKKIIITKRSIVILPSEKAPSLGEGKILSTKVLPDGQKELLIESTRHAVQNRSWLIACNKDDLDLIFAKTWPDDGPQLKKEIVPKWHVDQIQEIMALTPHSEKIVTVQLDQ